MNHIHYSNERTKAGELMSKEVPLQKIDYAHHRKTDRKPEHQDGSGAIFWLAVCAVCWIVALCLAGHAGYFD